MATAETVLIRVDRREVALARIRSALEATDLVSPAELRVLELASHGLNNDQIADEVGRSVETVKTQLRRAYAKLGADGRAHACATALRRGLIA